jgi:putative DNA primase/helicase
MSVHLDPRTIVGVLGGDVTGRNSCNVPGPGHSNADRSLSITVDPFAPDGFVVHSFANDDPLACKDHIRGALGLGAWERGKGRSHQAVADSGPDQGREERKKWALDLWMASKDPAGTIVERYLREHRALELIEGMAGRVIRFHPGLKCGDEYLPGMVCLMRDIVTNEACGIHRTFLDRRTGQKIDRKMLGPARGTAIKLDYPVDASLTIGEGVETVLSARMMGMGPVWALGSSVGISEFPVLKSLKEVVILEEHDLASRYAVESCGRRYYAAGTPVKVVTPDVGSDMNDQWRAAQ